MSVFGLFTFGNNLSLELLPQTRMFHWAPSFYRSSAVQVRFHWPYWGMKHLKKVGSTEVAHFPKGGAKKKCWLDDRNSLLEQKRESWESFAYAAVYNSGYRHLERDPTQDGTVVNQKEWDRRDTKLSQSATRSHSHESLLHYRVVYVGPLYIPDLGPFHNGLTPELLQMQIWLWSD